MVRSSHSPAKSDALEPVANLLTIGFTKKSAERFFSLLKSANVKTVVDTRLNNTGQLAGFAKRDDLRFFLDKILGIRYLHWIESAPTEELLAAYKKRKMTWDQYESEYRALIASRQLHLSQTAADLDSACLLCSEAKPHRCHRRVLAEYLKEKSQDQIEIRHLE